MVNVLVVDDDGAVREIVHTALEEAGYHVLEAQQGAEALEVLRETRTPMVVLVDLLMPVVSGFELLRQVADDWDLARRHAYVVVTGSEDALPVVRALRSSTVVEGIAKPFDIETLIAAVERASMVLAPVDELPRAAEKNVE